MSLQLKANLSRRAGTRGLLAVLSVLLLLGTGCQKRLLSYRTGEHLNATANASGQPVMLGFYQLSKRPDGLRELDCSQLSSAEKAEEVLSSVLLGKHVISVVPGSEGESEINRQAGSKWILIIPFFEICDPSVNSWALVRNRYLRRRIYVALDNHRLRLPWDARFQGRRPWRQRGNIDGESFRVLWRVR